jgi:branched-chain amino acid transport system ATP-binding protein
VCTIPEGRGVFPNLTVRENLLMVTHTGVSLADVEERAYARFPQLAERRHQLAGTMSGGEQQMLAMSRALSTQPAVLLLDELSMGLAPIVVGHLYEIVAQVADEGVSVLVVEQFARLVLGIADRAAIMLNGRITRVAAPDEIALELSAAYLGGKASR